MSDKEIVGNRKAYHDYEILETFEAGVSLQGTEVKALRDGGGSLQEAYIRIRDGEAFLLSATIFAYKFGNIHNHEERRDRKLLLHKEEIKALRKATEEKGLTVIPLSLYLKKGKVKVKIGIARGKKAHDKREAIKERDVKRTMQKELKNYSR